MIEAEEFQLGSPENLDDKWELLIERLSILSDKEKGWQDGNVAEVILGLAGDRYDENSGHPESRGPGEISSSQGLSRPSSSSHCEILRDQGLIRPSSNNAGAASNSQGQSSSSSLSASRSQGVLRQSSNTSGEALSSQDAPRQSPNTSSQTSGSQTPSSSIAVSRSHGHRRRPSIISQEALSIRDLRQGFLSQFSAQTNNEDRSSSIQDQQQWSFGNIGEASSSPISTPTINQSRPYGADADFEEETIFEGDMGDAMDEMTRLAVQLSLEEDEFSNGNGSSSFSSPSSSNQSSPDGNQSSCDPPSPASSTSSNFTFQHLKAELVYEYMLARLIATGRPIDIGLVPKDPVTGNPVMGIQLKGMIWDASTPEQKEALRLANLQR